MDVKTLHENLLKAMSCRLKRSSSNSENLEGDPTREKSVELANAWMAKLFDAYQEQKITDNKRIWEIGRIFVPIALSPFLIALDKTKGLNPLELGVCAGLSIGLYIFWLCFAERHREFQEANEHAQIMIVQQMADVSDGSLKTLTNLVVPECEAKRPWHWPRVKVIRWFGLVLLAIAWGFVVFSPRPWSQPSRCPKPNPTQQHMSPSSTPSGAATKIESKPTGQTISPPHTR